MLRFPPSALLNAPRILPPTPVRFDGRALANVTLNVHWSVEPLTIGPNPSVSLLCAHTLLAAPPVHWFAFSDPSAAVQDVVVGSVGPATLPAPAVASLMLEIAAPVIVHWTASMNELV